MSDSNPFRRGEDDDVRPRRGVAGDEPAARPRRGAETGAGDRDDSAFRRPSTGGPTATTSPSGGRATSATPGRGVREDVLVDAWDDEPSRPGSRGATAAPGAPRRNATWAWLVGVLVLAVVAGGGWWWHSRGTATPAAPVVPAPSSGASSASVSSAVPASSASPLPIEVPGPGTVESVRQHLVDAGFRCEAERRPGMASWLCTKYKDPVAMFAYVGGATGHRLGRVALNVQDGSDTPHPEALALQEWLAGQALPRADVTTTLAAVRKGSDDGYAEATAGPVHARGAADGSVVMFVDGWLPSDAFPHDLLPSKPLPKGLTDLGYDCSKSQQSTTCTRKLGGISQSVEYYSGDMSVTYLKVKSSSEGQPITGPALDQVKAVVRLFQERDAMQRWLDRHAADHAGATGFADDLMLDWYPGGSLPGKKTSVFYVRESCWTDTVENC